MNTNESPFREGWNSYWSGLNSNECPFPYDSSQYNEWMNGYYDALIWDCHGPIDGSSMEY